MSSVNYRSGQSKNTDDPVNQSKLEANTCSWRDAREKELSKQASRDWFWLRKLREVFKPMIGLEMQNEHKQIALMKPRLNDLEFFGVT